jgi:hypothetical protein
MFSNSLQHQMAFSIQQGREEDGIIARTGYFETARQEDIYSSFPIWRKRCTAKISAAFGAHKEGIQS